MSRRLLALAAASLLSAACADSTVLSPITPSGDAAHIVNGTPTGTSYGAVGALMFDYRQNGLSGSDAICTGALISPTVFLTAAHCLGDLSFTPAGSQVYVSFAPDLYAKGAKYIAATGYVYDPEYGHDQGNLHDIAVVFLPEGSTKGITPYRLPTFGELDALSAQGALNGSIWVNVGYGVSATQTGIPGFGYDGKRNVSESRYMGLQQYWLGLLMNTSATGLGGDCYGDSGGPKFLTTNPGVVYATVTTGDYNCRATTWDYRTDTDDARAFLGQYVTLR
jgi:V8-like Glu-specific endopeptidase